MHWIPVPYVPSLGEGGGSLRGNLFHQRTHYNFCSVDSSELETIFDLEKPLIPILPMKGGSQ